MTKKEEATKPMTVEIWSDVVCPWCYIGKRKFESALERFPHGKDVQVIWRSFQLDPEAPRQGRENVTDILARKYNVSRDQAAGMNARVTSIAAEEGLEYHLESARYTNTIDAHRLIHMAAARGLGALAKERLLHAYFTEGGDVGDHETLVAIGAGLGLPETEVREMLAGDAYREEVQEDIRRGASFGIRGVPFFVIDERIGVSGAQPVEVLLDALGQGWRASHPLEVIGGGDNVCTDDGCELPTGTP